MNRLKVAASAEKVIIESNSYESLIAHVINTDFARTFATMKKQALDTTKSYKTRRQFLIDLLFQPFMGVRKILDGVVAIVASLLPLFKTMFVPFDDPGNRKKKAANLLKFAGISFAGGLMQVFHGVSQILAWPFMLLRIPYRLYLTARYGRRRMEDSPGLRNLMQEFEKTDSPHSQALISEVLAEKISVMRLNKQKTNLDSEQFNKKFEPLKNAYDAVIQNRKNVIEANIIERDTGNIEIVKSVDSGTALLSEQLVSAAAQMITFFNQKGRPYYETNQPTLPKYTKTVTMTTN